MEQKQALSRHLPTQCLAIKDPVRSKHSISATFPLYDDQQLPIINMFKTVSKVDPHRRGFGLLTRANPAPCYS